MSIKNLFNDSFSSFRDNWLISVGVFTLYFIISLVFNVLIGVFSGIIELIFSFDPVVGVVFSQSFSQIVSLVIVPPLLVGLIIFSFNVSRDTEPHINDLFLGFKKRWSTSVFAYFIILIALIFYLSIVAIPGLITGNWIISIVTFLILCIPLTIISLMFSQTFFLISDDDRIGAIEAFSKSINMMRGYKTKYFLINLILSVITLLIIIITCGLGLLALPALSAFNYILLCKFYDYIKKNPVSTS